jgi:hypothetical protein
MRNLRDMYKRPSKQAVLSIGALLGNLEGGRLPGLLIRKQNSYLGYIFWNPEYNKILNLGAIWNVGKGTGVS